MLKSKIVFVFFIAFLSSVVCISQPLDILYFKKGNTLKGRVMDYVHGDYLNFLKDGKKLHFSGDSLKNIERVKLFESSYYQKEKGFWNEFHIGVLNGKTSQYAENESNPTLEWISGYRFNRYLGVGLGTGYQRYPNITILPLLCLLTNKLASVYFACW